ncbi:MAG: Cox family DNA-binding protein [Hafnia sp.]
MISESNAEALFSIPDFVTVDEFCRRTGKTYGSVRKLLERRRLPITTEKELFGGEAGERCILIMWNEWLRMCWEVTEKLPAYERMGWKTAYYKRKKSLEASISNPPSDLASTILTEVDEWEERQVV